MVLGLTFNVFLADHGRCDYPCATARALLGTLRALMRIGVLSAMFMAKFRPQGCFRDFIEGKRDFIQTMCLDLAQATGVPMSMEEDQASGAVLSGSGFARGCLYPPTGSPPSSVLSGLRSPNQVCRVCSSQS